MEIYSPTDTGIKFNKNLSTTRNTKNKTFEPQDISEYIRFRMNELNNEIVQKINKNKLQSEHIANLEMKVDTYKKNISSLHDRIAKQDNMKIEITLQNKKISELEKDLNNGYMENKKLKDMLTEKMNIISEFQSLVDISSEKFKIFEETNLGK